MTGMVEALKKIYLFAIFAFIDRNAKGVLFWHFDLINRVVIKMSETLEDLIYSCINLTSLPLLIG